MIHVCSMEEARSVAEGRVYVVDDDPELRGLIRRFLAELGADVEEFESAEEFLDGYSERPIGCILLDIQLPGMDGFELLEQISGLSPANPVIMLSRFGDIPAAVRALQLDALDFLEKPFRKEQLLKAVDRAFDKIATITAGDRAFQSLTPREREVLKAFGSGAPNKIVALELGLSPRTVEMYRASIFRKLGVSNLAQALLRARDAGFLPGRADLSG